MLFFGLQRITEIAGVVVSFDPKPIPVNTHISPNIFNLICSLILIAHKHVISESV